MNPARVNQSSASGSSLGGLWSLLWRAVLLTPFAIIFGIMWVVAWPLLVVLPICEINCLWAKDWVSALIIGVVWVVCFWFTQSRWVKAGHDNFLNSHENV